MQNIIPVSGLPRAGSTLFQQIIGQNPKFYPTPTSGFINFFMSSKRQWKQNNEFSSEGMEKVYPRINNSFRGMFEGYFSEELSEGKIIFEKSRGWVAYIEYLKEIFQDPDFKVICMVRDIRAIVASFEKLYRNRGIEYPEHSDEDFLEAQTVEGRANILLKKGGVIGMPITRLQDALRRHPNNIVIVPYQKLLSDPKTTMLTLHDILGMQRYEYDFNNIKQVTNEHDVYHGYKGLHDIREGAITPPEGTPWAGMFEDSFIDEIGQRYSFLNNIANS
jgi:sulfotransferase